MEKIQRKLEKTHCSCGLTATHGHSCLGRPGPAWPAHSARARPGRSCAWSPRTSVSSACGAARSSTAHRRLKPYQRRKNGLGSTVVAPLHRKLDGNDGKGVLIGAELDSVEALGVEADKCLDEEDVPQPWFSSSTRTTQA
jgi:hypothetical protein